MSEELEKNEELEASEKQDWMEDYILLKEKMIRALNDIDTEIQKNKKDLASLKSRIAKRESLRIKNDRELESLIAIQNQTIGEIQGLKGGYHTLKSELEANLTTRQEEELKGKGL